MKFTYDVEEVENRIIVKRGQYTIAMIEIVDESISIISLTNIQLPVGYIVDFISRWQDGGNENKVGFGNKQIHNTGMVRGI